MVYSKARLQHALDVYHKAWELSASVLSIKERHLREDYQFRRVKSASNFTQAISWYDDDSSDEYRPTTTKKRRLSVRKIPKAKRTKQETKTPGLAPPSPHKSLSLVVILKLKSSAGRAFLSDLINRTSTYSEIKSDSNDANGGVFNCDAGHKPSSSRHYDTLLDATSMNTQDEESDSISGGTNHSGLDKNRDPLVEVGSSAACEDAVEITALPPQQSPRPTQPAPMHITRAAVVEIQQARDALAGDSREHPIILDSPPSSAQLASQNEPFTVRTPWAHPINFKHVERPDQPCHFCEDFRYGIYGYGFIRVKVFESSGELHEVGYGHRSMGKDETRMCVNCSLNRLNISRCEVHTMRRFANPSNELYQQYIGQLTDNNYPNGSPLKRGVFHTCSLCPQAAVWRCCADQSVDKYFRILADGKGRGRGCGLILCDSCARQVEIDKGVLKKTTVQQLNGYDCQRADMEFLFAGSLLDKAWP